MEQEINFLKTPKLSIDIKQTSKGVWYVGSLKINAETVEELDTLIESTISGLKLKIEKLNSEKALVKKTSPEPILDSKEKQLFTRLKEIRMELARKENYPPYVICHDSVLKQLDKQKPRTKEDMLKIGSIGEKRFEKYGEIFLKTISEFGRDSDL